MYPPHEHAFYAWLIIIAAVCLAIIIGALIDRFILKRQIRDQLRRHPIAVSSNGYKDK